MSRQAQNVLMGAIACLVVAVAMVAVALSLTGGDDSTTAAGETLPASGGVTSASDDETALPSSSIASPSAMAVTTPEELTTTTALTTTTIAIVTTTAAPVTTVATTAAPTTVEVSTTVATSTTEAPSTSMDDSVTTTTAPTSGSSSSVAESPSTTADGETTTSTGTETTVEQTTTTVETPTSTDPPSSGSLNAVEVEIARLTNELRTNPNGGLKRQGNAIDCSGRVGVDLSSGQYTAIGALTVDQTASLQVARPWSAQMSTTNFVHQPRAGITALQAAGISVRAAGENIAYHNFSDKALNHFVGWRESDGHFCNMMDPNFTHIGVGEVTKSDGISYATQNFFSTR